MLNNDELWEKSQELAELLNEASSDKDKSISTKRKIWLRQCSMQLIRNSS